MKTIKLFHAEPQPRVTKSDRRRLSPHLTGWNRMTDLLSIGTICEDDLKRLIIIEAEGRKRKPILRRLIGRLATMQQQKLLEAICA